MRPMSCLIRLLFSGVPDDVLRDAGYIDTCRLLPVMPSTPPASTDRLRIRRSQADLPWQSRPTDQMSFEEFEQWEARAADCFHAAIDWARSTEQRLEMFEILRSYRLGEALLALSQLHEGDYPRDLPLRRAEFVKHVARLCKWQRDAFRDAQFRERLWGQRPQSVR